LPRGRGGRKSFAVKGTNKDVLSHGPHDRSRKIEGESVDLSTAGLGKLITVRFACSKRRN